MTALSRLRGTVVIDEVQRRPDLFSVLRVLADRRPLPARFLILGSATPSMLRQASETLAGRVEIIEMGGLSLEEVGATTLDRHWLRGGFPLSYLARSVADSFSWRRDFVRTFIEREIPSFGIGIPPMTLLRFWTMLAHVHGGLWNAAEPARSLGISEPTVRRYLDVLCGVFMARQLPPWHENLSKRQVKSPKVYFRDSGLLHCLLGLRTERELLSHPKSGASWEGYAVEEMLKVVEPEQAYFWATHSGAELDLLLFKDGRRLGVEMKRADAPRLTPSMRSALEDLRLEQLVVLYPGETEYELAENVRVVPLSSLPLGVKSVFPRGRRKRKSR
jgi:predicted AAA+ superfamily ATPase